VDHAKSLDDIGWGLFLLMTGALWLFASAVPSGAWLVGTGILLLALNAVRYLRGMELNVFTLVLGGLALAGGLAELAQVRIPLLALALVAVGLALLVRPLLRAGR
jgi:hypothetical protein